MAANPVRIGVACPIPGERAAFLEWLTLAGYEPDADAEHRHGWPRPHHAADRSADRRRVARFSQPTSRASSRRSARTGRWCWWAIRKTPSKRCRADATWIDRPVTRDTFLLSVALALAEGRPARRSPRKLVPRLMSSIDGVSSKVVDVSLEGVRLEITGAIAGGAAAVLHVARAGLRRGGEGQAGVGGHAGAGLDVVRRHRRAPDRQECGGVEQVRGERAWQRRDRSRSSRGPRRPSSAFALALLLESAQSASNTCRIFLATAGLLMINPTSRRFSSSIVRRLWLPTNAFVPSRTMARTCSRMPASLRSSNAGVLALHAADDAHLDALGGALLQQLDHRRVLDLGVVDRQFRSGAGDEGAQHRARVLGTDDEVRLARRVAAGDCCRLRTTSLASATALASRVEIAKLRLLLDVELGEVEAVTGAAPNRRS